ncbi:hypothetical protein ACIA6D_30490 [Streptomyces cacaoi]|uniref:hypothetical protein n=1 Tax=Streptomyces cacaoi TaxID=1898 RepID=UPI00374A94CC
MSKSFTRTKAVIAGLSAAAAASAVILATGGTAHAQLDPDGKAFDIFQNNVKVGEIFVPERSQGDTDYLENWVLFPKYQYPGPQHPGLATVIKAGTTEYKSQSDFFENVPFKPGSKYVAVDSHESSGLPQ